MVILHHLLKNLNFTTQDVVFLYSASPILQPLLSPSPSSPLLQLVETIQRRIQDLLFLLLLSHSLVYRFVRWAERIIGGNWRLLVVCVTGHGAFEYVAVRQVCCPGKREGS
jgi:hypothetical protein